VKNRAKQIIALVKKHFPGLRLAEKRIRRAKKTTVIRLRLVEDPVAIELREVWSGGSLIGYGYQLLLGNKPLLRYDNAPHHPEVETHPHHKHVGNRVEPLHDHSLEAFLEEARQLLEQQSQGSQ